MFYFVDDLTDAQRANARRWVETLRNGPHRQGQRYLRQRDASGQLSYCCLGVAVHLHAPQRWIERGALEGGAVYYQATGGTAGHVGADVMDSVGLRSPDGSASWRTLPSLTQLNDAKGLSFAAIADVLEADLAGSGVEGLVEIIGASAHG